MIQTLLRHVAYELMNHGIQDLEFDSKIAYQVIDMALKTSKAWFRVNNLDESSRFCKLVFQLLETMEESHDFKSAMINAKIQSAQIDWQSRKPSAFLHVKSLLNEYVETMDEKHLKIVIRACVDMAKVSSEKDALKWYEMCRVPIDATIANHKLYTALKREIMLLLINTHLNLSEVERAEEILDGMHDLHCCEMYYTRMKILELRSAPPLEFQKVLESMKSQITTFTKEDFHWFIAMIHLISKNGGFEYALEQLKESCNQTTGGFRQCLQDLAARDQILVTSIYLILESNVEDKVGQITNAFDRYGDIDLGSEVSKSCLVFFS